MMNLFIFIHRELKRLMKEAAENAFMVHSIEKLWSVRFWKALGFFGLLDTVIVQMCGFFSS